MKRAMLACLLALVPAVAAPPAGASQWFLHKFGELRSYHGHFLNVCRNGGLGPCRTVQYNIPPGGDPFFGDAALKVHVQESEARHVIEIYANALPPTPAGPIVFDIDGEVVVLSDDQWRPGTGDGFNVTQTLHVTDEGLNARLVGLMMKGNRLRVVHGSGAGELRFSLHGLTAALDAIETHLATPY